MEFLEKQKGIEQGLRRLALHQVGNSQPKYERLKNFLAAEVTAGRLRPGEALPSEQHLAEILRIARTTVRQALSELEDDGFVRRVHGAGTFVSDEPRQTRKKSLDAFALVTPISGENLYVSLQRGFEAAANQSHNQILVCSSDNNLERQGNIFLQLVQKRVAGVALVPTSLPPTPAYQVSHLQQNGIPVVFCHRGVEGIGAPLVAIPFFDVGRRAGKLLLEHGHRRVAFFSIHPKTEASEGYHEGLKEILRAGGGEVPEELVHWGTSSSPNVSAQEAAVHDALKQMFHLDQPPTAIVASCDPLAELIYLLLGQMGIRVPEDVSLVGFGAAWRNGPIYERLTSVTVDENDLGRRAANLLLEMGGGQRPLDDTEKIPVLVGLAAGRTVGPAPMDRKPMYRVT